MDGRERSATSADGPERRAEVSWVSRHAVDLAFGALAVGWLANMLRVTGGFYFWGDDLRLIGRAGSVGDWLEPYNQHMSLTILVVYRAMAEVSGLSYAPFALAGALALLAVPVGYYTTTRSRLGPFLAAVVAVPLLWPRGLIMRPASMNHYFVLVGAIVCAAALNRGRRADGVLAGSLLFALCSAGGGLVVAVACLAHNVVVRPPLRRWLAVVVPLGLWFGWWWLVADRVSGSSGLTISEVAPLARDLCLAPFRQVAFGNTLIAAALVVAYLAFGVWQLRRGLVAGANFLVWSGAIVLWAVALTRSRGLGADPDTFRYTYLSLGFALLALVPREPIAWPRRASLTPTRWVAAAAIVVLLGTAQAAVVRDRLQGFASTHTDLGLEAKGTFLALDLGPDAIPDTHSIAFFAFNLPHGNAGQTRALIDRYGSPYRVRTGNVDEQLVEMGVVRARARVRGVRSFPGCRTIVEPLELPGVPNRFLSAPQPGASASTEEATPRLWSSDGYTIEIRRYGDEWVRLADVPAGRVVTLELPALDTEAPWEIRADGACDVTEGG